ncbi:MAG: hypothetical protein JWN27_2243 [Candidatus Eremiobacteraeota bacterium]|nr:hypothetical protein [Candidatus Eremiobacteraeota bacterium]
MRSIVNRNPTTPAALALALVAFAICAVPARAQTAAAPTSSVSPSPSPRPGSVHWTLDAHTTFVTQGTNGPGTRPPEAAGFANGDPLSPETPYDVFSSAPLVPGNASESAIIVQPAYSGKTFDAVLSLGAGYVRGSVTNAAYWGESLLPTMNPHLGATVLPYRITFPTHAGADDGTAFVASVLGGSIATKDGSAVLKGGWFDLTQTAPFVFVQPAITSAIPAIGMAPPETLGDGAPSLDLWQPSSPVYPLHGVDAVLRHGLATIELADASLPALPGTAARMRTASLVVDHGAGTRYTAQMLQVSTGGDLVSTTVLYGAGGHIENTPQGPLPVSTIGGQRQRIFGVAAAFHPIRTADAIVELGHSTYDADSVAEPGTGKAGNYYHAGISRTAGRATASLDLYRNEAYYANALLPYGAQENVWSVAWSWPGQWLKSNYQLINDFPVNIDRQGYRLRYGLKGPGSPLDVRVSFANFTQIQAITMSNALRTGFIDGFFLPQSDAYATLGRQHQYGLFVGYHRPFGDVTFDYAEDTMRRPAALSQPEDTVSYDNPEAVLTFSHRIGAATLVSAGLARYGMRGSFGQAYTNIDFAERIGFVGVEFAQSAHATALLSVRRTAFGGIPIQLAGPSPDFTGMLLLFEQRYHL